MNPESLLLHPQIKIMRGGAGVARWAHNPKVVGSNPAPATGNKATLITWLCYFSTLILFS